MLFRNSSSFAPWPFSRFTTNAVYNHIDNTVYIPTGLAQKPFYSPTWDDALQLVSLGYVFPRPVWFFGVLARLALGVNPRLAPYFNFGPRR